MMICPHCFNPLSDEAYEQRVYDRCIIRVGQLEGENEKLRELVRDIWDAYRCEEVAPNVAEHWHNRMRELGIEVDAWM